MLVNKKIIGEKVSLAYISMGDADNLANWLNDFNVSLPLGYEAYTPTSAERIRNEVSGIINSNQHVFSIFHNESNKCIGRCALFNIDFINRTSMLSILIGDKNLWNKGFGKEAITLLIDYAFNLINLNSVRLSVFSFNENAVKCYKSVGFKEVGRLRQAKIIGQIKYDSIVMDILAEEFRSRIIPRYIK
ncbi:GNAT family N-acetyltransferase [Clostridium akagii]|uniref:GNAT family N-acetyltransferase n=1 Tax=Clostridium akagii TaxID=91623 RepID=UPI00047EEB05|nr:GNAT family protein [Clostridium akagii]